MFAKPSEWSYPTLGFCMTLTVGWLLSGCVSVCIIASEFLCFVADGLHDPLFTMYKQCKNKLLIICLLYTICILHVHASCDCLFPSKHTGTCGLSTYLSVTDRDRLQVTLHLLSYTTSSGDVEFILSYGVLVGREGHIVFQVTLQNVKIFLTMWFWRYFYCW